MIQVATHLADYILYQLRRKDQ